VIWRESHWFQVIASITLEPGDTEIGVDTFGSKVPINIFW
jgi:hypothetical protein